MSFKEQVEADIDNVFFNDKEFAESVLIDGKPVPIISDNDALNGKSDVYAEGLSEGDQLIFIKQKDLSHLPPPGERITIDGKHWYVRHAISNMGIYEIRIGRTQNQRS